MPFVNDMSEVLIVKLVRLISSVKTTGSENGQEPWVIAALLAKKAQSHLNLQF